MKYFTWLLHGGRPAHVSVRAHGEIERKTQPGDARVRGDAREASQRNSVDVSLASDWALLFDCSCDAAHSTFQANQHGCHRHR